jgi:HK97 family phage portal protein
VLTYGNAYAEIEVNNSGVPVGLWPLLPDRTSVERVNGVRQYLTEMPNGQRIRLASDRVLHVPGLSFDGLRGYSPIQLAKSALGLTAATEQFGAGFFGRGASPAGVLEHPKGLSPEAVKRLRESWDALQGGLSNSHRIAILEDGMTWKTTTIPPEHAQFLETRKFQVSEIARMFRVPPHMLADLEGGASYASVEQMSLDFVTYTLRPWLVRWEQAFNHALFPEHERSEFFAEHLVDGLLRGDIQSRYGAYAIARQWGWLSADDIRELENQNPLPDDQGSLYLVPLNMVSADKAGEPVEPTPAPAAPAPDADDRAALPLYRDVGERLTRRLVEQLRRAHRKHPDAEGWADAVDAIFRDHADALARAVAPVLDAALAFGPVESRGLARAARGLAVELAQVEATACRGLLTAAGHAGAEALLTAWETDQPDIFAARATQFVRELTTDQTRAA